MLGVIRERNVMGYLAKRVCAAGGDVRRVKWIGRRSAPDKVVMFPPSTTIWVETKRPNGKRRPDQLREHERMRKMGQWVEIIDCFDAVDKLIDTLTAANDE